MAAQRYDSGAMALHWSMTLLIVAAFALGLTIDNFPKEMKSAAINAHALIGLAVLFLSVARLYWRFANPPPPLPASVGPVTRIASGTAHFGLYTLMIAIPLIAI